jgi:hypothetical protein
MSNSDCRDGYSISVPRAAKIGFDAQPAGITVLQGLQRLASRMACIIDNPE